MIHTFGYSPATAAAIRWSRDHDIPLVIELVITGATPYQYLPGLKRFSPYDLAHQSVIVAISRDLGDLCQGLGLNENVWTRPNPVDTRKFEVSNNSDRLTARHKISTASENDTLVVYVAKYLNRKKHSFLLEVLAKLPARFKLVLAGPALEDRDLVPGLKADQIPMLKQRANALGIGDRVEITHGFIDMVEYLAAADVFCFPAQDEGMGTPLLEALSSGTPVVANADEPSFGEWIIDGENGYLAPLNAEQWASAVQTAAEFGETQRKQISQSVKARISSDVIDKQYLRLMNTLAETAPGQAVDVEQVLSS